MFFKKRYSFKHRKNLHKYKEGVNINIKKINFKIDKEKANNIKTISAKLNTTQQDLLVNIVSKWLENWTDNYQINFDKEFIYNELHKKVPFFRTLNENKKKKEDPLDPLSIRNSIRLYNDENYGLFFKREIEPYFGNYINNLVLTQSIFNHEKALQIKIPKLLKEISTFYNKKIYTTLVHEGNVKKTINQMEDIEYPDGSYATNIYLNRTQFLKLRKYLIKEKINAGITLNCIDYYGVKYHNLLEAVPEGEYLALNKYNPPAIINHSIEVEYNEYDKNTRMDIELWLNIEVYNPDDIIHGQIKIN